MIQADSILGLYLFTCGAIVAAAGLVTAWGLLGWLGKNAWLGTLQRAGVASMFFLWCRNEFHAGRHPRLYRWIFREDLPERDETGEGAP